MIRYFKLLLIVFAVILSTNLKAITSTIDTIPPINSEAMLSITDTSSFAYKLTQASLLKGTVRVPKSEIAIAKIKVSQYIAQYNTMYSLYQNSLVQISILKSNITNYKNKLNIEKDKFRTLNNLNMEFEEANTSLNKVNLKLTRSNKRLRSKGWISLVTGVLVGGLIVGVIR